ncbi:MAG: hypothetical protein HYW77_01155 [Parcubacteria group bacterium]|nr:hypothetical protein [Parcubacteria group bacterium]
MLSERAKLLLSNIVYRSLFGVFFTYEQIESVGLKDALTELFEKKIIRECMFHEKRFIVLVEHEKELENFLAMRKVAEQKKGTLIKYLKFFRISPFIRAVFISGSLTLGRVEDDSDLDVFVLTAPDRIWTARFLLSAILSLFGIRRTKFESIAPNKICLSHYMTTNALFDYESIFTAQVLGNLELLWEAKPEIGKTFVRKHKWLRKYLLISPNELLEKQVNKIGQSLVQKIGEWFLNGWFGSIIEWFLRIIQLRRIKNDPKTLRPNGRIVATDQMLEFHPDSKEGEVIRDYNLAMKKLGFPEFANERSSKMEVVISN